ncbi:MAG: IcmG [uncultured bacterium]|nr:MAG: IcmG [uncultured bacterium]HBS52290.1 hypothetical protein [Coxiellaceae bacterium]
MDDKTTLPDSASEYKLNESEGAAPDLAAEQQNSESLAVEETASVSSSNLKNINWKRFAAPLMIALSILLVYAAFSFYASKKASLSQQQKIMPQQTQPQVVPTVVSSPPMSLSTGISNDQIAKTQSTMQQNIDSMVQQVKSNQDSISSLNASVAKTQQDVSAISQQIGQLAVAMQQMLVEVEKIQSKKVKPKKTVAKLPVAYHIRAIVPGRVWLESADGKSVTLRVGDNLEGYGAVRVISSRQGMVVMSNGSIIQYGVNDF